MLRPALAVIDHFLLLYSQSWNKGSGPADGLHFKVPLTISEQIPLGTSFFEHSLYNVLVIVKREISE